MPRGDNGLNRLPRALENGQVDDCRKTRIKIGEARIQAMHRTGTTRRIQTGIPAALFGPTLRLGLLCAELKSLLFTLIHLSTRF